MSLFNSNNSRSKVYQCQERHCEGHGGYRIQENRVQNASRCIVCGSDVKENCRARDIGDEVLGLLVSPYALKNSASEEFLRHQSILVCFQGNYNFPFSLITMFC